ncbi:Na/Pi cotransporter family protein [Diaphorobacter nitroreducens]|uniref:Na/Pi cotransporter family protein n=1 Tax=Diaphorobacter nitroreducens TaxID=164759 RepID=UPI0028AF9AEA|nr:Na/Pi symporter [Diaphorobacter nitroreducens]
MTATATPLIAAGTLLGGIGLFLLGMTMLTDGLKLAAGRALERILAAWTRTPLHGLVTGVALTALVQSSTAMTVAAIGFVNAGLLGFSSALWVVFGSNLGSSVTGWLVAWLGFAVKADAFALPFIGIGMALQITGSGTRRGALGQAVAGFGVLFLGIELLRNGFTGLGPQALPPLSSDLPGLALAVLIGLGMTVVLQASSATLAVVLTAVAGGSLAVEVGAGVVIGANVGTTLTGILAAIHATSNARRLAAAHVLFNVVTAAAALALLSPLLAAIHHLGVWLTGEGDAVTQLVIFHTAFNLLGVLLMWPLSGPLARFLLARFRSADEDVARAQFLDHNVAAVPALALQALRREMARVGHLALQLASDATRMAPVALPWQPAGAQAASQLTRQLQALEQLQQQVGAFVSDVSRQPLSRDVADQMPELLRIAGYYDTLARVMHQVGQQALRVTHPATVAPTTPEGHPLAALPLAFTAAQDFFAAADPKAHDLDQVNTAHAVFDAAYEAAKAAVLRAGAQGLLEVTAVHEWTGLLGDLRRAVEQAHKAAQHLAALPRLKPTPPANGPASGTPSAE